MKACFAFLIWCCIASTSFAFYDSQIGRWMSRDPIAAEHHDYMACVNNHISRCDVLGLWVEYGSPYVDRTVNMGSESFVIRNGHSILRDFRLVIDGGVIFPTYWGYVGYVRQHCECSCTVYDLTISYSKYCDHYVRKVRYGESDPCNGSYSGTNIEELFWKSRTSKEIFYSALGPTILKTSAPMNAQTDFDCKEGCALACLSKQENKIPISPEFDCSSCK